MNKYERPVVVTKPRSHNVWLFERPYRVDALIRCREAGLSGRKYWEELALWWKDSENIFQNKAKWRKLWRAPDKGREYAMEENDRSDFASLPEQIAVYRGCRRKDDRGWSWTIDREPNFSPIVPAPRERDRDITGIVKRSVVLTLSFHDGVAPEKEIVSDRVRIYGHG